MEINKNWMRLAIQLSEENIENGGEPFGAVIVKDGQIVATGVNRVRRDTDPTAHAEVTAIRNAARNLHSYDLSGCEIYTSCEPCPMCLAAIYWAKIEVMYYGNTSTDAKMAGFDDSHIYREIILDQQARQLHATRLLPEEALAAFEKWKTLDDRNDF